MRILHLAAAVAALALGACISVTPPGILVASTPPGARVLVDGRDSGFVTPCNLAVEEGRDHWIALELEGYATTSLRIQESSDTEVVPWSQGIVAPPTIPFPLFLPAKDLFFPFRTDDSPRPGRIYVEMRLAAAE